MSATMPNILLCRLAHVEANVTMAAVPLRSSQSSRALRAAAARADLDRARGRPVRFARPQQRQHARWGLPWRTTLTTSDPLRLLGHACLMMLVALVLIMEQPGGRPEPLVEALDQLSPAPPVALQPAIDCEAVGGERDGSCIGTVPMVQASDFELSQSSVPEPIAPMLQQPLELVAAFQAYHPLASGETLGDVALRYEVPIETLVWANDLDRGDALMVGQRLRIPRLPGLPYTVATGETIDQLALRFGVAPEAITTFAPNRINDVQRLRAGQEIFIPGGTRPMASDWLEFLGGADRIPSLTSKPAGVVRSMQTNLRLGPSTEYPRLIQLDAGRRLALRARHDDWLLVALGATQGWVRQDLLDLVAAEVAALPESNDFPPPPPRWVWPSRGVLTSRYGPRWGGFHNGIDIASSAWTPIVAARTGQVREAGWCSGYGYCVKLSHGGGVETIYGHLITTPVVRTGQQVTVGELIGHMGSTYDRSGGGYSTGVHLHFTILVNGRAVDPLRFLP